VSRPATVVVDFPVPPDAAYAYLSDPRRRPEWQSSLRRVADVAGAGEVGTTWHDVTSVGAQPAMRVTEADPPRRWAETGSWRGIEADLALDFQPQVTGTRVVATFEVRAPRLLAPLAVVLGRLAPLGVRSDLRRAARQVGS
jgi:uncharacterized protein YndB with AHSA1/START domain